MNEYDVAELRRAMAPVALYYWTELASTNSWALEQIAAEQSLAPSVVLTANQTAGRGRMGRQWQSDRGGITCSWVLERPLDTASRQPVAAGRLSIATAVAVFQTLAQWLNLKELQVKWPNDLLVGEEKICGILIESVLRPIPLDVIGIGINVNLQRLPDLQESRNPGDATKPVRRATSVLEQLGYPLSMTEVLIALHHNLIRNSKRLVGAWEDLRQEYESHMFGREYGLRLETPQGTVEGRCHGIDDQGALMLETSRGLQSIVAGTVIEWTPNGGGQT